MQKNIFLGTAGTSIFIALSGIASGSILARLLGPEERGELTAIILWAPLIAALFLAGIHESANYYTARSNTIKKSKQITISVLWLSIILSFIGLIFGSVIFLFSPVNKFNETTVTLSLIYLIYVPIYIISTSLLGVDQGKQYFKAYNLTRILQPFSYLIGIGVLYINNIINLTNLVILLLITSSFPLFIRVYSYRWALFIKPTLYYSSAIFYQGLKYHSAFIVFMVSSQLDRIILVSIANFNDVGIYTVAYSLMYAATNLIGSTFQTIIFPLATRIKHQNERLLYISGMFQAAFFVLFVAVVILIFMASIIVPFIFGDDFSGAIIISQILAAGYGFLTIKNIIVRSIRALGNTKLGLQAELVYGVSIVIITLIFYFLINITAYIIAIIVLCSSILCVIFVLFYFCKYYKVSIKNLFNIKSGVKVLTSLIIY